MPTTWYVTGSNSDTNVMTQVNLASPGDIVQLLAGSASWPANSVYASGITLQGVCAAEPTLTKGAGTSSTIITISGTYGNATFTASKHATFKTIIRGIKFVVDGTHDNDNIHPIENTGAWTGYEPIIYRNCTFDMTVGATIMRHYSAGGLIVSHCSVLGSFNSFLVTVEGTAYPASWTTADSIGTADTTGKLNCYFENNSIFRCSNGWIDADNNARVVDRYNEYTNCGGFNSHGYDSSPYGMRHFEIYQNSFLFTVGYYDGSLTTLYPYPTPTVAYEGNIAQYIWIRGGTGVIYNNAFSYAQTQDWGAKHTIKWSIRAAEEDFTAEQPGCAYLSYPIPKQIGQNHNGSAYFTDPIYVWGNTGTFFDQFTWFHTPANPCGITYTDYWQSGRDYVLSGGDGTGATAKPGYTAYTFPHPLLTEDAAPAPPSILLSQVLL